MTVAAGADVPVATGVAVTVNVEDGDAKRVAVPVSVGDLVDVIVTIGDGELVNVDDGVVVAVGPADTCCSSVLLAS